MEEQARDQYIRMRHDLLSILRDHGRTYAEEGQALIEQARNDANEQLNMVKNFYEHRLGKLNERMEQALLDLEAKYNADTVHSNCPNPMIGQVSDCPQNEHVSPQTNTIGTLPNLNNYINFQQESSSRNDGEKQQMIQPPVKSIIRPKFQKGDNKLTSDIEYTLWRHRIRHELLSQDCLFLIDKDIQPTQIYDDKMINLMKSSVISYLLSNLVERLQRHVRHAHDPAEMMSELDKVCDLTSSFSEHQYRTMFNNIKYDPRQQSVMDFLNEFDDLIEKIRKCPDSQLSDSQIKHNLLTAFAEALPNVVSSLKQEPRPGKSIQEIKDALQSEERMLKELHRRSSSGKGLYGKTRYSYPKRPYSTLHNEKSDQYQRSTHKSFRRPPTCKNCGIQGHMADQCRKSGRVCYNCGRDYGHISADCPDALTESSKQHRQVQNQKTPAQVRIEHTKAKQFRNKKKSWPKRRQMPFKAAIAESKRRAKEGKSFLAIIADPQNNDPEQMCRVEEVDSDDGTDHAMYTHHHNNDHDDSPSGAAFSNIERSFRKDVTGVTMASSLNLHHLDDPHLKGNPLITEINSQLALFRDLLIHIGTSRDSPELREKIRKLRRMCVDACRNTAQHLLPQIRSAVAEGIPVDNPHLILVFYMCQLFLRELAKCSRLVQLIPMDMSGYFENRAGPSNLGNVISQILLCKTIAPDFNQEEICSIAKDSQELSRLLSEMQEFLPTQDSNSERTTALASEEVGTKWNKKCRRQSLYRNFGTFCCIQRHNYL